MTSLLRMPKVPRFDAKRDGNPFDWIVRTAPLVREERQNADDQHRQIRRIEERLYRKPVKP